MSTRCVPFRTALQEESYTDSVIHRSVHPPLSTTVHIFALNILLIACLLVRVLVFDCVSCCRNLQSRLDFVRKHRKCDPQQRGNSKLQKDRIKPRVCNCTSPLIGFSFMICVGISIVSLYQLRYPRTTEFPQLISPRRTAVTSGIRACFAFLAFIRFLWKCAFSRRWIDHRILRTETSFLHLFRKPKVSRSVLRRYRGQSKYCKQWHVRSRRANQCSSDSSRFFGLHDYPKCHSIRNCYFYLNWLFPTICFYQILLFAKGWKAATQLSMNDVQESYHRYKSMDCFRQFLHQKCFSKWGKLCNHRLRQVHSILSDSLRNLTHQGCQVVWTVCIVGPIKCHHTNVSGHSHCKTSKNRPWEDHTILTSYNQESSHNCRDVQNFKKASDTQKFPKFGPPKLTNEGGHKGVWGAQARNRPFQRRDDMNMCSHSPLQVLRGPKNVVVRVFVILSFVGVMYQCCHSPWLGHRVGEAKNPGPPFPEDSLLDIGTFNPTALMGKEQDVINFGRGIFGASETSVTATSQPIIRNQLQKAGFFTAWSKPVEPQKHQVSLLRGRASGTAIVSSYPLRPFPEPISKELWDTHRYVDAVAQVHTNCVMYFGSLYGAANTKSHVDPLALTNSVFSQAAERAMNFQGPAVIVGDFNWNLSDLAGWHTLVKMGWMDAAILDAQLYGREPQVTCNDATRKSFILINRALTGVLMECRTQEDFLFSAHPLLLGRFRFKNLCQPCLQWRLPKATDDLFFDAALAEDQAKQSFNNHQNKLQQAIQNQQMDEAAKIFARTVQEVWKASCVDCEGYPTYIKPGYLNRDNFEPLKVAFNSIPVVRAARHGDYDPKIGQTNVSLRRHIRQLR